jgi:hypothetical protein
MLWRLSPTNGRAMDEQGQDYIRVRRLLFGCLGLIFVVVGLVRGGDRGVTATRENTPATASIDFVCADCQFSEISMCRLAEKYEAKSKMQ